MTTVFVQHAKLAVMYRHLTLLMLQNNVARALSDLSNGGCFRVACFL